MLIFFADFPFDLCVHNPHIQYDQYVYETRAYGEKSTVNTAFVKTLFFLKLIYIWPKGKNVCEQKRKKKR